MKRYTLRLYPERRAIHQQALAAIQEARRQAPAKSLNEIVAEALAAYGVLLKRRRRTSVSVTQDAEVDELEMHAPADEGDRRPKRSGGGRLDRLIGNLATAMEDER